MPSVRRSLLVAFSLAVAATGSAAAPREELCALEPPVDQRRSENAARFGGAGDTDGDGLADADELLLGTDAWDVDSDCDGHDDATEVGPSTSTPLDGDGDGRIDALESGRVDSDLDGIFDEQDASAGWQPGCVRFRPFAIPTDGSGATRAEARIVGPGITAVSIGGTAQIPGIVVDGVPMPNTGTIALYDDGTHGDRLAGDGIWSRDSITAGTPPIRLSDRVFNLIHVTDGAGTTTKDLYSIAGGISGAIYLGFVAPSEVRARIQVAPGFQRVKHLVNMIDPVHAVSARRYLMAEPPIGLLPLTNAFYAVFPDDYDFLFVVPELPATRGLRGTTANVSNAVTGIGRLIADQTSSYGSAGRLQAVVIRNFMYNGPNLHELQHRWVPGLDASLGFYQCSPSHWGYSGIGTSPIGGFDPSTWMDHGDGTYSVANFAPGGGVDSTPYNPLDLYVAGLLPPDAVPPMLMPIGINCASVVCEGTNCARLRFAAGGANTLTIDDVIAVHGPRIPGYGDAPSAYRTAWIVPSQYPLDDTEMAYYASQARYLGEPVGDGGFFKTFTEATLGRASMDTSIDAAAGPSGAVPEGASRPGTPLTLERDAVGLVLRWGASCTAADEDYVIYRGSLGDFTSHLPLACSTFGYTEQTVALPAGDAYYLVVPRTADHEGSYGLQTTGERPASSTACLPQALAACAR